MQAPLVAELLSAGHLVVCVGGGGVPIKIDSKGRRQTGMQAVVDKDLASAALAAELKADTLIMLTDGDYVSENWGTPEQRDILTASADAISELAFEEGSMQPKVNAAIRVARAGGRALIGPLDRLDDLLARTVGTEIRPVVDGGIVFA
jgi:carbamate kinase